MSRINRIRPFIRSGRRNQRGYAILLVLFFVTLMLLATISVAPNILTAGRREKEKEMIWRGNQYTRGIKLYYRKTGKFPNSMEDLTKPKIGSLRFMRQAYKDPMNAKDGEWRLIYVGPAGQLIGSLKPPRNIQLSGVPGLGGVPGTPAAQLGAQANAQGLGQGIGQAVNQVFGGAGSSNSSAAPNSPGQPNSTGQLNNSGANGANVASAGTDAATADAAGSSSSSSAADDALLNSDPVTVVGGNIIGVGSKVNQRSIVVYDKADNYKKFEFIWDPSKDTITIGGAAGPQIGTPAGLPGQTSPFGLPANPAGNPGSPGSAPLSPQPGPPETSPAPPPQQP
ncbi:MAG TPA: hypothetical protein VGF20_13555 [Candidatus Acidoferrum sp.]